jgi:hypothetical protein
MNTKIPYTMSAALLSTYTTENRTFQRLGVWSRGTASITGGDAPEEVESLNVSHGTLPALGVQPALASVTDVSFAGREPMSSAPGRSVITVEDHPATDTASAQQPVRWFRYAAPGFLRTVGTPLVAGRDFTDADLVEHRPVVVISENLARELWQAPGAAIGRRIREGSGEPLARDRRRGRRRLRSRRAGAGAGDRVLADADGAVQRQSHEPAASGDLR